MSLKAPSRPQCEPDESKSQEPKTAAAAISAATPSDPCSVHENSDGSADVTLYITADEMKRIRTRAQTQPLARYMWWNMFKRAIDTHIY